MDFFKIYFFLKLNYSGYSVLNDNFTAFLYWQTVKWVPQEGISSAPLVKISMTDKEILIHKRIPVTPLIKSPRRTRGYLEKGILFSFSLCKRIIDDEKKDDPRRLWNKFFWPAVRKVWEPLSYTIVSTAFSFFLSRLKLFTFYALSNVN